METIAQILLYIHITIGFASLILFIIPIISRKGGKLHRRIGKLYVLGMWVVVSTAAILSIYDLFIGKINQGIFLGFISCLSARPLWYGIAILKEKKNISNSYIRIKLILDSILLFIGILLVIYGILLQSRGEGTGVLMLIFGGLGITTLSDVKKGLKGIPDGNNWIQTHLIGMMISGITAYTAFFVFGGNSYLRAYLDGYWGVIPWILPTIIGFPIIKYWKRKYASKQKKSDYQATSA